jgi:hypothetical protein
MGLKVDGAISKFIKSKTFGYFSMVSFLKTVFVFDKSSEYLPHTKLYFSKI